MINWLILAPSSVLEWHSWWVGKRQRCLCPFNHRSANKWNRVGLFVAEHFRLSITGDSVATLAQNWWMQRLHRNAGARKKERNEGKKKENKDKSCQSGRWKMGTKWNSLRRGGAIIAKVITPNSFNWGNCDGTVATFQIPPSCIIANLHSIQRHRAHLWEIASGEVWARGSLLKRGSIQLEICLENSEWYLARSNEEVNPTIFFFFSKITNVWLSFQSARLEIKVTFDCD